MFTMFTLAKAERGVTNFTNFATLNSLLSLRPDPCGEAKQIYSYIGSAFERPSAGERFAEQLSRAVSPGDWRAWE